MRLETGYVGRLWQTYLRNLHLALVGGQSGRVQQSSKSLKVKLVVGGCAISPHVVEVKLPLLADLAACGLHLVIHDDRWPASSSDFADVLENPDVWTVLMA